MVSRINKVGKPGVGERILSHVVAPTLSRLKYGIPVGLAAGGALALSKFLERQGNASSSNEVS